MLTSKKYSVHGKYSLSRDAKWARLSVKPQRITLNLVGHKWWAPHCWQTGFCGLCCGWTLFIWVFETVVIKAVRRDICGLSMVTTEVFGTEHFILAIHWAAKKRCQPPVSSWVERTELNGLIPVNVFLFGWTDLLRKDAFTVLYICTQFLRWLHISTL